jgi:hypothetical protein
MIDNDFVTLETSEREYGIAEKLINKWGITVNDDDQLCVHGKPIEDEYDLERMIAAHIAEQCEDSEVDPKRIIAYIKQAAEDKTE